MSSVVALLTALYSASVLLRDIIACLRALQEIRLGPRKTAYSLWIACHLDYQPSPHPGMQKEPLNERDEDTKHKWLCKEYSAECA
jgi:hypothetical protein